MDLDDDRINRTSICLHREMDGMFTGNPQNVLGIHGKGYLLLLKEIRFNRDRESIPLLNIEESTGKEETPFKELLIVQQTIRLSIYHLSFFFISLPGDYQR